jgi:hypothetical protein
MYFLLLRLVRRYRNLLRTFRHRLGRESFAIAGELEDSLLTKISSAFDYINLLQLFYLFVVMMFASRHYCRRLPQIARGKNPILPDSAQMVTLIATLLGAGALILHEKPDKLFLLGGVLLAGFSAPLWAPVISICIFVPAQLFRKSFLHVFLSNNTRLLAFNPDYLPSVAQKRNLQTIELESVPMGDVLLPCSFYIGGVSAIGDDYGVCRHLGQR